jgi:hypothetical protein
LSQTILAFGYKKNRGKDSVANFIQDHLSAFAPELKVVKVGFADKLKDIAFQLYGWAGLKRGVYYETHYEEKEMKLPRLDFTPRELWIGTGNKMRDVYGATWIDFVLNGGIKADVILIKDMGYTNEAIAIENRGGFLYKVDRDGPLDSDPRETELDSWTRWAREIDNSGDLRDLHTQAKGICMEVFQV